MDQVMKQKEYCPTCQHVIAKDMVNLSSLEFRCLIHRITDIEEFDNIKDRLYRFIKSFYRVKEFADQFLEDLENKINGGVLLEDIKLWLLGFINNEDRPFPPKELSLYKLLCWDGSAIDMTFADFYEYYLSWVDNNPMSKNRVSRALSAFGLKPVMKKIMVDGKMKCTIMLCATEEELAKLCQKNGFALVPKGAPTEA
jgi:hypothetical protein